MNLSFKLTKTFKKTFTFALVLASLFSSFSLLAEPYLSFKTHQECSACHVNPAGGGMRTTYGNIYGYSQMPVEASDTNNFDFAKISNFVKFGGNLRYDFETSDNDTSDENQNSFNVQSAQIYTEIKAGRDDLSLYLDQQVSPGTALSREAMIIKRFEDGDYLKIGKMMPSLGLRIEDDSAFIRQVTGFNFDNSDNGVEYGLRTDSALFNFFVTNGTNSVSNDDNKFQLGTRAEFYFDEFRIGGAFVFNDGEQGDRQILTIFAAYHWNDFTLMGEVDSVSVKSPNDLNNLGSPTLTELVGLIELNYEIGKGHNMKITGEFYDPDNDLDEDQDIRHSIIYEYTPYSNIQLRFGYRKREAPPQQLDQNVNQAFVQTHFYF